MPGPVSESYDPCPDDEPFTCWCGETVLYEDMCDDSVFDEPCGGSGMLDCYCGGDLCVCHNHGEIECPGCEDCEEGDDEDYGYDDVP